MSKNSEAVKLWRKNTKRKMVEAMGSHCQICKYNKCFDALELHHINPSEKEFGFGAIMAHPVKWDIIKEELKKCILLCSNCHREVHDNLVEIPKIYQQFDESLIIATPLKNKIITNCPVCNEIKNNYRTTCSTKCAASLKGKVDWDSIDLIDLVENQNIPKTKIADQMNCSDQAVSKRYKKLKAALLIKE